MISLKNINKIYKKKDLEVPVLNNVNLEIKQGELIAIVGPSGSGKSTLLNILGCLDKQTSGKYFLKGEDISKMSAKEMAGLRNSTFGFIVQDFALINEYTVTQNVEIPLLYSKQKKDKDAIDIVLKQLSIIDKKKELTSNLSGGQKQRVAIARSIINNPDIILADEPTGSLDQKTGHDVMNILMDLHKQGKTVIIITHDSNVAALCNREISIVDGIVTG